MMEIEEIGYYNTLMVGDLDELPPPVIEDAPLLLERLKEDLWSFRYFWYEITQKFSSVEELYAAIQDLRKTIQEVKEKYRSIALGFPDLRIERNTHGGVSGSYFLIDAEGNRRFVIKPVDEDAGCINSDDFATPFTMSPLRDNMPLYHSSMREVLGSLIAEAIGVCDVVPKTVFGIFESDKFHDFSEGVSFSELQRYMEQCGTVTREKLCSVQEYVPNSKSLFEAIHELEMSGLSDEEIAQRFDQSNFEDANILLWTTYDTDGHMGNFLVYPKGMDQTGNEILGIKKIDNGLAFPDKNEQLRNNLSYLPNANKELSAEGKAKIDAIDVDRLAAQFEKMGLESAIPALKERIPYLKELAARPGITLKEMNTAMSKIGKKL